jgi:hypothetical protein
MKFLKGKKHLYKVISSCGKINIDFGSKNRRVSLQLK